MTRIFVPPGTEMLGCHCGAVTKPMSAYAALTRVEQWKFESDIRDCPRCKEEFASRRRPH